MFMKSVLLLVAVAICIEARSPVRKRAAGDCPEECESIPLDISFIVDASASIWPDNFTIGLWFVSDFVNQFTIGPEQVRVSMVTYGDRVYTEDAFDFNAYTSNSDLTTAIDEIPYPAGQSTETGKAISWFLANQRPQTRTGVRSVLIVLTDGNSQEPDVTKAEADKANEAGLEVFVVGVGHEISQEELHNIATDGSHVYVVNDYKSLSNVLNRLAVDTCGGAPIKPKPMVECTNSPVDISFVIDSSTSIGQANFTIELEFIKEFLSAFTIAPYSTRVAAIMFGDRVYDEDVIGFGDYTSKKDTLDAILALKWKHGQSTNTGEGINYVINHFSREFREGVPHIGIVITDGQSQETQKTKDAAQMARDNGIYMLAVGVGEIGGAISQEELNNIAGDASRVLTADNFAALNSIWKNLLHLTCLGINPEV